MTHLKNIFIVDDDKIFVFLTGKTIKETKLEAEIKEFGNGRVAIDYLRQNKDNPELLPDVIFLDLNMPVMDGWEFLNQYMAMEPEVREKIKLYIFSSSISPHDVERAKGFSAVADFLIKPLSRQKFMEIYKNEEC